MGIGMYEVWYLYRPSAYYVVSSIGMSRNHQSGVFILSGSVLILAKHQYRYYYGGVKIWGNTQMRPYDAFS